MTPQSEKQPNILVIWGDDIGITNLSCYSDGLMGYRTPNIDRLAKEGMKFTDCYGEQSCTAGRSAFITGQSVFRTGLSKVGVPASPVGLQAEDPTDPFERADTTSNTYYDWVIDHAPQILAAQAIVVPFLGTFKEFPPRQKAASFTIDQALAKMSEAASARH